MAGLTGNIQKQLEELRSHISEQHNNCQSVKVLKNTDNLIVKLNQFLKYNINLTIQLPGIYLIIEKQSFQYLICVNFFKDDLDLAQVIVCVTCSKASQPLSGSEELQHHLNNYIYNSFDNQHDRNLFISLFEEACSYVKEHFIATEEVQPFKSKDTKKTNKASKGSDSEEGATEKKRSMKTSTDVLNRIMWDNEVKKEFITVGYLDRFLGIKECAFSDFDWGDIVNADLGRST